MASRRVFVQGGAFLVVFAPPAIVFFGSRWLSQIPIGPIFLYDLLLGILGLLALSVLFTARDGLGGRPLYLSLWVLVLPIAATIQLFPSGFSLASLREFAPYLYMVYGWFVALVLPLVPPHLVRKGVVTVIVSLGLHWLWVVVARFGWANKSGIGVEDFEVFSVRADIDTTLVGVFGAVLLGMAFGLKGSWVIRSLLVVSSLVVMVEVFLSETRAGHLASVAALAIFVLLTFRSHGANQHGRTLFMSLVSSIWIVVLIVPLAFSPMAGKYAGMIEALADRVVEPQVSVAEGEPPAGPEPVVGEPGTETGGVEDQSPVSSGTSNARLNSWGALIGWMFDEPSRVILGVGFGSGFMYESGALEQLIGPSAEDRRDEGIGPHNFLLFTFATMGVFSALYFLVFLALVGLRGLSLLTGSDSLLHPIALSVLAGVIVASLFGVVFEAPHGAIPMAWAIGVVLAGLSAGGKTGPQGAKKIASKM